MNAKVIVKVMNFHSLLRVDASRRRAEKYRLLEDEITDMIDIILHNRNFILDKRTVRVDPTMPTLTLFIGSDFGFCGSINAAVNSATASGDAGDARVLVGKKLRAKADVLFRIPRETFFTEYDKIEQLIDDAVRNKRYSSITLWYNHYYNAGTIAPVEKKIFPIEFDPHERPHNDDFMVEGDVNTLLESLVATYLNYEIKIAAVNSFASENIMRQSATTESLKRIEEHEEEQRLSERRRKNQIAFHKVIDAFTRKKGIEGGQA